MLQGIGHNHSTIKEMGRIGAGRNISLRRKIQLCGAVIPLSFGNHFRGSIRRFDMLCRADNVLCNQPRAGGKLREVLDFDRPDQRICRYAAASFRVKRSYRFAFFIPKSPRARSVVPTSRTQRSITVHYLPIQRLADR
ncbi:MAG: hypothetical protein ACLVB5_11910 [Christensenellales bacterium]